MEWNEETVARLIGLWAEGHSTAEIGRRINVSKNSVVGKAHRLNLPARRRRSAGMAPRVHPVLPPASHCRSHSAAASGRSVVVGGATARNFGVAGPGPDRGVQHGGEAASAAPRSAPVRPVLARATRPAACCWPIGEPGTKDFHFCDGEAMPGKPYCAEHAQIAYVKVRDRREGSG